MSMIEAGVLIFIVAIFVIFGIVLAWETHWEEEDRAARARRFHDVVEKHGPGGIEPSGIESHQGADG